MPLCFQILGDNPRVEDDSVGTNDLVSTNVLRQGLYSEEMIVSNWTCVVIEGLNCSNASISTRNSRVSHNPIW